MSKKIGFIILLLTVFLTPLFSYAQNLTPEQEKKLRAELEQVEKEQAKAEAELKNAQAQSSSISRDISILDAKIKVAQLNIKAKNLQIETLGKDINKKVAYIGTLENRIGRGKETLAQIMRKTNEVDSYSLAELLLSQNTLTGFFEDLDDFESVQTGLKNTFEQLRDDKSETEAEKSTLEKRRNAETDAKYVIEQQKKSIEADTKEKQRLLAISKGNEAAYQADLQKKMARAAEIRSALFPLRDSEPIKFEEAYNYAINASKATGVSAAFILAIFAQESGLSSDATFGKNVGSCYMTDPITGNGKGANTGSNQIRVMSPARDAPPFLQITKELGKNYSTTRVSCWIENYVYDYNPVTKKKDIKVPYGWGGAMGPAQFIPSTWMLIKPQLQKALGISTMPNPWNAGHAFMAASFLLRDSGAATQQYSDEKNAACRYYSGRSCSESVFGNTYGNQVMIKKDTIQRTMIDLL